MIDALLVDFDGTLVFTEHANARAYSSALQKHGFNISPDLVLGSILGRHWKDFLPELIGGVYTESLGVAVSDLKRCIYSGMAQQMQVNHDLVSLLQSARGMVKTALVSNASKVSVLHILKSNGLLYLFDYIVCAEDVSVGKPSPESYLLALKLLQVDASKCLAIEDSEVGIAAAKAALIPVWVIKDERSRNRHA